MKLAIVTNILTPYRVPLFAAMAERVEHLRVFVMAANEENRDWHLPRAAFDWQVLPGWHVRLPGAPIALHLNHGVGRALREFDPDVVLSGGFAPANVAAWSFCLRRRRAFVNWGELSALDLTVSLPKRLLRRVLIGGGRAAIASSSSARAVFIHYGAKPQSVLTALMPIEVERFRDAAEQYRSGAASAAARSTYSGPVLLNVGRLVDSKGCRELFAIYAELLNTHPGATLLIAGDGPRRAFYEELARARGWSNVRFLGYQQADEVAKLLALADAFVFPTLADPYGAVLCEAMAAGLPVAASVHAGATLDLVEDGVSGVRIEPRDAISSAASIRRLLALTAVERTALCTSALARVRQCDIGHGADAMVQFLGALTTGQSLPDRTRTLTSTGSGGSR
jgi:glycosyltransferase involved in cell wall biosynthesis